MLPSSYQLPVAALLVLAGIVACFFGYRLFRLVLAIFGFILGVLVASSVFGAGDYWWMVGTAVVGGLAGAGLFFAAYFVGVALAGAVLGAVAAHMLLTAGRQDPHLLVLIFCAVAGAVAAVYLQRYVIIVGTAFAGAWIIIVGAMAVIGDQTMLEAAASGDVWVLYPLEPAPGRTWVPIAWIVVGLMGTGVQLGWTGGERGRVGRRRRKKSD